MQNFVKGHQDVAFDILAALENSLIPEPGAPRPTKTAGRAAATAKELLEEITEPRAIEMEFRTPFRSTTTSAITALRRRGLSFWMVPVRAQLIVLPPFLRVAEDFVGLVDFFELLLGSGFVPGDVGVVLAGQLAERFLDLRVARVPGHAKNIVVILEFNGHRWFHHLLLRSDYPSSHQLIQFFKFVVGPRGRYTPLRRFKNLGSTMNKYHPTAMVTLSTLFIIIFAMTAMGAETQAPDPREIPLPPIKTTLGSLPGVSDLPIRKEMPDALVMNDGTKITTVGQWKLRREEIRKTLEYYAVGRMPPPPGNVKGDEIKSQLVLDGKVKYRLVHLMFGPGNKLELNIGVFTLTGGGPFPTVIMPGGTPPGATPLPTLPRPPGQGRGVDALLLAELTTLPVTNAGPSEAAVGTNAAARPAGRGGPTDAETIAGRNRELFQRGYAYVMFNNNDCAEDTTQRNSDGSWAFRTTRFYPSYPDYDWGVLAGWAWGVSRIVDYLETDPSIDKTKLIISGVSRTGKSALIAGAFDDRLAMTAPCVTGGGGIGAYRFSGASRGGKEGLAEMMKKYPNWFSPHLHEFWGQVDKLPFDEHWFLALVAPRPFIALEGRTDQVSLANAVKRSFVGARPAYALFGATDRLGINYANHGHAFTQDDWSALMDFADKHLRGMKVDRRFDGFLSEAAPGTPPGQPTP